MSRSHQLFLEAQQYIPGGVNSPVRAFGRVGGHPRFFKKGEGPFLFDEDGRRYIDYVGSWGPMILGHAHPEVIRRVAEAARSGLSFGAPTEIETRLAQEVIKLMPDIELLRMVNSGTEATMSAIRVARGFTGRDLILKFEGCYHGHSDSLLVKAGSGALAMGEPDSLGVPASLARHTLTAEYNNIEQVTRVFRARGDRLAAVILEPVAGNMGCIPPVAGFLETTRDLCSRYGALLIFDEVMTGFRVAPGGAQALYNIKPDLTTLGKIIGGGMPVGAFGGRRDVMETVAPLGAVYQAGTLSGNPVAMHAGLATLEIIRTPGFYTSLAKATERLMDGFVHAAGSACVPLTTNRVGSMFGFFFTDGPVTGFSQVMGADMDAFRRFFNAMLEGGVNLAPSPFESGFVSAAHDDRIIDETLAVATEAFASLNH